VWPTLTRGNGGGGTQLWTAGGDAVGFRHDGEALDNGGGAVGFRPALSGRACEAASGRRRSDRSDQDAGFKARARARGSAATAHGTTPR
jgi:hypothetical protein